ncbi:hypothetical protein Ac2012v2_006142 [Leucoagaricus gongylophorus]
MESSTTADTIGSLNVEESRAKRLERQQARLRDRGGIFRPANRNNNLFDVLVQATHRKSPCRSRSVSPQKKVKTPKKVQVLSSSKSSVFKCKSALGIDMITEPDLVVQNQTKNLKGKQKQGLEMEVDNEDGSSKSSKKAVPKHKQNTVPRRRTKSSTNDEWSEGKPSPEKFQKIKPRGRRKKTDVNEVEAVAIPPPKELSVEQAKCRSAPKIFANAEKEKNSYKSKSHHEARDEVYKEKHIKIKIDKPPKAKVDRFSRIDSPWEQVIPTKSRSRKHKLVTAGVQNFKAENDAPAEPCSISMSRALVDAINEPLAKEYSGHKNKKATLEAPRSDRQNIDPQPRIAPKAKRKRPQAPAEVADETEVEVITKRPKTATVKPQRDVLRPKATGPSENRSPYRTKPVKESVKDDSRKRTLNHISKKWKENATVSRPIKNKIRSKGDPCIPLQKKLNAQHNIYPSDDEPDPIDFLS